LSAVTRLLTLRRLSLILTRLRVSVSPMLLQFAIRVEGLVAHVTSLILHRFSSDLGMPLVCTHMHSVKKQVRRMLTPRFFPG
jgi:hypothetical protein